MIRERHKYTRPCITSPNIDKNIGQKILNESMVVLSLKCKSVLRRNNTLKPAQLNQAKP